MKNFKFTINGNVYEVGIEAAENGKSNVNVNGKSYVVEVEAEDDHCRTPAANQRKGLPCNGEESYSHHHVDNRL